MNQLYPLKFKPIYKEKVWGGNRLNKVLNKPVSEDLKIGESWEISGIDDNISVVENGFLANNDLQELIEIYMGDLVGERVYDQFGLDFPLLIKFIDSNEPLSVQVHPNDELASKRHGGFGKTEMWYIINAEKNALIYSGFNNEMDKDHYLHHLENKEFVQILNDFKAKPNEVYYLPSGRVHAIGAGILLTEIQQTSDITYRIYDWDRTDENGNSRELHTDLATDAIDFKKYTNYKIDYSLVKNQSSKIISNKYFQTNIIDFDKTIEKDYITLDSFVILMCIDGDFDLIYYDNERIHVKKGETILIPAVIEQIILKPVNQSRVLEIFLPENADEPTDI
ncbi:MAG: mannose-6-phosphate isomerase [Bacteroidetes bacterium GWF2_33_16]|nr:MAG: mannose-6-phosphate isomerase [Bacteroidetes bacterium GWE2_32_14]OFY08848.1 MAG: mannose-6-phosphate isomerase [Bacteroidetes bacterium GWF2_33_16]